MAGPHNHLETGPLALIKAIFDRAWRDIELGNVHAQDALAFVWDSNTMRVLAGWGIDPQYYVHLMLDGGASSEAERDRRIQALYEQGLSRTEISLILWDSLGANYYRRVAHALDPSD